MDLKRQKPFISIYYYFFSHHLELMATHSSVLAWKIPGMGEPGGLPSMGSHRVRHDLVTQPPPCFPYIIKKLTVYQIIYLSSFICTSPSNGRRQWHPTLVPSPGKSHGWRSLVGCSSWGREESDTTERLHFHLSLSCTGEGNGNPLQCSCLENPRDGGAWWAAVYGVAQSGTRLK